MTTRPHILLLFGTRPEAIKLAPVVEALKRVDELRVTVCVTAQHRELLDDALSTFGLVPDIDLDLMRHDQELAALTARVIGRTREVITAVEPDLVVVQGDTTSAMASALSAYFAAVPVAHVEAGLRTGHLDDPWPEEANRRLITQLATLHFAPTEAARSNLRAEGIDDAQIIVTGNTSIDALHAVTPSPSGVGEDDLLVTCHRRESVRDGFRTVIGILTAVASAFPGRRIVCPLHPNPRVHRPLVEALEALENVELRPPFSYREMIDAVARARVIMTDSGGLQEEAAWFGTPCLVLRRHTDRPESVAAGLAFETQLDSLRTVDLLREVFRSSSPRTRGAPVFGAGDASARIARELCRFFER